MKYILLMLALTSCDQPSSDERQQSQQETLLQEGTSSVGMPAIKNFRERRLMRTILELRDQENVSTYTYLWSDFQGKLNFMCDSIGYGLPASVQFTSPSKIVYGIEHLVVVPQADPNGLFSPAAAEGTWVMCVDPSTKQPRPVYVEQRVVVSPFKMGGEK